MDLCRANERNAAALTLTSIGQQPSSADQVSSSTSSSAAVTSSDMSRMPGDVGATWVLMDSNSVDQTVVAQHETTSGTHSEGNHDPAWSKQQQQPQQQGHHHAQDDIGSIVYADVVQQQPLPLGGRHNNNDGIATQSM